MSIEAKEIVKLREKLGWSQSELARALGIAQAMTISHWETGTSKPSSIASQFLRLLATLSDLERQKIASHLTQLSRSKI